MYCKFVSQVNQTVERFFVLKFSQATVEPGILHNYFTTELSNEDEKVEGGYRVREYRYLCGVMWCLMLVKYNLCIKVVWIRMMLDYSFCSLLAVLHRNFHLQAKYTVEVSRSARTKIFKLRTMQIQNLRRSSPWKMFCMHFLIYFAETAFIPIVRSSNLLR